MSDLTQLLWPSPTFYCSRSEFRLAASPALFVDAFSSASKRCSSLFARASSFNLSVFANSRVVFEAQPKRVSLVDDECTASEQGYTQP